MVASLHPSTDLVAAEWIRTIPGLTADGVGNQLPADETTWAINGYVVVPVTVGGTPHSTTPLRRPVVQVECWADNLSSDKIPWQKAAQLAEQIRFGTYDRATFGRALAIVNGPVSYGIATVKSALMLTEPHRIWSDAGDYGGYGFDLRLDWTTPETV
ncbi:MAG: hypothetical protein ACRDP5_24095 [Streptosporangiaceae bacterium]